MHTSKRSILFTTIGSIAVIIPFAIALLWIGLCRRNLSQPETVELFRSYFPAFLQARYSTIYLSVVSSVIALIASGKALNSSTNTTRVINTIIITLAAALLIYNLFGLM